MTDPKPRVVPAPLTSFYWTAALQERLSILRCESCRYYVHPPLPRCPNCHSSDLEPNDVSGRGSIYSYAIVRRVFHPGFASDIPYPLAIIELAEQRGLWMITNLVGCEPEQIAIGKRVQLTFERRGDERLPQFMLVDGPEA